MARYVTRARRVRADSDWYEPPLITNIEVMEGEPVWTGLLDKDGNDIMRMNDPIGFIHFDD